MSHEEDASTMRSDLCLLFPVDVDESTETLLPAAKEMQDIGVSEIRLLHVVHPVDALAVPDILDARKEILIRYRKTLLEQGIPVVHGEVVIGTPWLEIAERARSAEVAFILMGSLGKGLFQRIFLGSQTENVLYHTGKTLFIIRMFAEEDRYRLSQEHLFTHILYATDLSEGSRKGIPYIERMARSSARLTIAHVEDIRHFEYASADVLQQMRNSVNTELAALREGFLKKGFGEVEIVSRKGNAISELLNLIEEVTPSLLVMGAKGTYDIAERALGGVANTLIHRAPVHILLCRD
jgi:nucleotide-binding universal stress UspA family protein